MLFVSWYLVEGLAVKQSSTYFKNKESLKGNLYIMGCLRFEVGTTCAKTLEMGNPTAQPSVGL